MAELQDNLPPGWDCKMDNITGRSYFINHFTKMTTWDDPRNRHRPFHGGPKHFNNIEQIPLQHGSPDLKRNYVYPSQTSPIPAFQMPPYQSSKTNTFQELRSISRMSPLSVRTSRIQDTNLGGCITDTEEAVGKIGAMFPTVSESHIKLLMKKYHNREALVISALQVDKYPITTPGPFVTPPPQRNIQHPNIHALQMTPPLGFGSSSRGGSPILRTTSGTNSTYTGSPCFGDTFRSSPRPHSSPKLKLRYMKSIFPKAEETVILEVLTNNENNIQKSSDVLKEMGYSRKDAVKVAQQKLEAKKEKERIEEKKKIEEKPFILPKLKNLQEKATIREKLQEKYKDVPDHLITIALESVDFNEKRASQILDIMVQEDSEKNSKLSSNQKMEDEEEILEITATCSSTASTLPISQSRQSIKSLLKSERNDKDKNVFVRVIEESNIDYKSPNLINTNGANPDILQGANGKNLLEDYVKWQGPNQNLRKGSQSLAKGTNATLLSNRTYKPCGSNADLCKGPKFGLAKGSIFSHLKTITIGDYRSK